MTRNRIILLILSLQLLPFLSPSTFSTIIPFSQVRDAVAQTPSVISYDVYTNDTNSMTWAVNAQTGVTDFQDTDASLVLQQSIDAANGCIHVTTGVYEVIGLQLKDNTCINGDGPGSTILLGKAGTINRQVLSSTLNGKFSDLLENIQIRDLEIDGSQMGTGSYSIGDKGIGGAYWKQALFENLYIHGTPATCLGIDYPQEVFISHVMVADCGTDDISQGSNGFGIGTGGLAYESLVISDSISINTANSGFLVEELDSKATSRRSYLFDSNISFEDKKGFSVSGTDNVIISNNGVWKSNSDGIRAIKFVNHVPERLIISANSVVEALGEGIYIDREVSRFKVADNNVIFSAKQGILVRGNNGEVIGNQIEGSGTHGLFLGAAAGGPPVNNIIISSNNIYNNGRLAPQFSDGISLNPFGNSISDIIIVGNHAYDNQSPKIQRYGLVLSGGNSISDVIISSNNFGDNRVGAIYGINASNTNNVVISANIT